MANPFDQFDSPAPANSGAAGGNPFDQFDTPKPPRVPGLSLPGHQEIEGFKLHQLGDPTQKADPLTPYAINKAKMGAASIPGLGAMALDIASYPDRKILEAMGSKSDFAKEGMPLTTRYTLGSQAALGVDPEMKIPKDEWGSPRLGAEMAGNIAEMAGASVLPSASVISRSARPFHAAAKEALGIVLGGEGVTGGTHAVPKEYEPLGGAVGSLFGPLMIQSLYEGAVKGGNWSFSLAKQKARITGFTEKSRAEDAAQRAAGELKPHFDTPAVQKTIADTKSVVDQIPGMKESMTLGRMTDSPTIKSTEQHFAGTDADAMDMAHQRAKGLSTSIEAYKESKFPKPVDESTAISGVQKQAEQKIASLDAQLAKVEADEAALGAKHQRGDIELSGEQSLNVRTRLKDAVKAAATARYERTFDAATKAGVKVDQTDVRDLAAAINKDSGNAFQDKPGVIGDILRKYSKDAEKPVFKTTPTGAKIRQGTTGKPKEPIVDLKEFVSLYQEAGKEVRRLSAAAKMGVEGAENQARLVGKIYALAHAKITEMEKPIYGEVGKLLKDSNQFYNSKYIQIFKKGVGAEMVAPGQFGRRTSNENAKIFRSLVFKPRDSSGVREYLSMVGDDKAGMEALNNGVMDIFSREVVKDGKVNPEALKRFTQDMYKETLAAVPWIAEHIQSVGKAAKYLSEHRETILKEQSDFSKSVVAKIAKLENPDEAMAMAMEYPSQMKALVNGAQTLGEKQALAKSMLEYVTAKKGSLNFFQANRETIEGAIGKTQTANMETILHAEDIAGRITPPEHLTFEKLGDPLSQKIGTSIPQAISEQRAVSQRFANPMYAASRVGVRWWNQIRNDQRDKIMKTVIFNPEAADALVKQLRTPSAANESAFKNYFSHIVKSENFPPYVARSAASGYSATTRKPGEADETDKALRRSKELRRSRMEASGE